MSHPYLQALVVAAQALGPIRVAIAYPCDAPSLGAAIEAARAGLVVPLLVGPEARIRALAKAHGLDLSACERTNTPDDPKAAAVAHEAGLRGDTRASHAFVMDVPGVNHPLVRTDCVVNIAPTLMDKRDIEQNAVDFAKAIGIEVPHVATAAIAWTQSSWV